MNDTAEKRKDRLKALRAKAEDNSSAATGEAPRGVRRGAGGRGAGGQGAGGRGAGGRGAGPGFRTKILTLLKNVEDGDSVVEGTQVGHKQLVKLMGFVDKMESKGRGTKLKEKITELLSPIESDDGFQFNAEGVNKLVKFLEQEPAQGGARAGRAGGGGRARGGRGQGRGVGAGGAAGGARRGFDKAQGGSGQLRKTIEELSKKVDALSKASES